MTLRTRGIGICLVLLGIGTVAVARAQPAMDHCPLDYPAQRQMSLDAILRILDASDYSRSLCAMEQVPRFGARVIKPLMAMLHSTRASTRANAADALAGLGHLADPGVPVLIGMLDDTGLLVNREALDAIGHIQPRSPEATSALVQRLIRFSRHGGNDDVGSLLFALANIGKLPPGTLAPLTAMARNDSHFNFVVRVISHVQSPQTIPVLVELIGHDHWLSSRRWKPVATLLGRFGARALPELLPALFLAAQGDDKVRFRQLWFATRLATRVALTPGLAGLYQADLVELDRQLVDPDPAVRERALEVADHFVPAFAALSKAGGWGRGLGGDCPTYTGALAEFVHTVDAASRIATDPGVQRHAKRVAAELKAAYRPAAPCVVA
ncbi:MAG: HEAT repeat domain-containing protein [Rhodanobacteraceae bacterium]